MSISKNKIKNSMSSKLNNKILELPLNKGFKRGLIKREGDKLISVYYITPDNKYLKDLSDVYDWIEKEKQEDVMSRRNFNFVAKKLTSHSSEFIIDYDALPTDIRACVIQKKRSIAPSIVTIETDDTVGSIPDPINEVITDVPRKRIRIETNIVEDEEVVDMIQNEPKTSENEIKNSESIVQEQNESMDILPTEPEIELSESLDCVNVTIHSEGTNNLHIEPNDSSPIEFIKKSLNCAPESLLDGSKYSFEYPLSAVNMNGLIEIGSNFHTTRIMEAQNGEIQIENVGSIISYCGNHCAFDNAGCPRIAFECDICLILWHNDCIGYRWLTLGSVNLIVCDNCFIVRKSLSVDICNTFCDVEKLLHSEFNPELNINSRAISIPAKLESIFKLCKVQWILQNKNKLSETVSKNLVTSQSIVTIKNIQQDVRLTPTSDYRYFLTIFITPDQIVHGLQGNLLRLKYALKDVDLMAHIFADLRCGLMFNDEKLVVYTHRVSVKDDVLLVPVLKLNAQRGHAMFFTYENGQDTNPIYISRYENLKAAMCTSDMIVTKKVPNLSLKSSTSLPNVVNVTRATAPLPNNIKMMPVTRVPKPTPVQTPATSILSQQLSKNVIPISKIQTYSNVIKIRKRKQDISVPNQSIMSSNSSMIQYYNLADLPFHLLERILMSRNLNTTDKLNCRLVNRVLKCVVDGGRVLNKVVINPKFVTGLQAMLDFFSKRNVKKITFFITFNESFGVEFFTSFISRLKLYPDCCHFDAISVKLMGINKSLAKYTLSIQDILSSNKFLRRLSVISDQRISVVLGKGNSLKSDSLEVLKLTNIENIHEILNANHDFTPKLKSIYCGDFSRMNSVETFSLMFITSLRMEFSSYVHLTDLSPFSQLTSLEHLIISRPGINETLKNLLVHILKNNLLSYFRLESEVTSKEQLSMCLPLCSYFQHHIRQIYWHIYMKSSLRTSDPHFKKKIMDFMPSNVRIRILNG